MNTLKLLVFRVVTRMLTLFRTEEQHSTPLKKFIKRNIIVMKHDKNVSKIIF
jgi:hypothetical protein